MSQQQQDAAASAPWTDVDDLNVCLIHAVAGVQWHLLEHLALGRTSAELSARWHAVVYRGVAPKGVLAEYVESLQSADAGHVLGDQFKAAFLAVKRKHPDVAAALYAAHGAPEDCEMRAAEAKLADKLASVP